MGGEKPCLKWDVPPVFLLNCACDFIRVKHYSPRTEQANFDGIKRFIDFHGKRHPPEVRPTYGIWAEYLIDRPGSTSTLQRPLWGAVHYATTGREPPIRWRSHSAESDPDQPVDLLRSGRKNQVARPPRRVRPKRSMTCNAPVTGSPRPRAAVAIAE